MFERYVLTYVFLCFVIGVACLGLLLNLARRPSADLARSFLPFYVALSVLVSSALLLKLSDAFPDSVGPRGRSALEYVQSILGFYGVMFTLPHFVHRAYGVAETGRTRLLLVYVGVAVALQHVTEYVLGGVWDQRGDLAENLLFLVVIGYVVHLIWTHRESRVAKRPLASRIPWLVGLGLPMIVYDVLLADITGVPLYPIGYVVFSLTVVTALGSSAGAPAEPAGGDPRWGLSDREEEVLRLVQRGLTNKDIGAHLHISPNTVKTHLRSIFEKAGAKSRFELIAMARGASAGTD